MVDKENKQRNNQIRRPLRDITTEASVDSQAAAS